MNLADRAAMYTLASDEKKTTVVLYSRNKLIHGDFVTRKEVYVSVWPRTDMPAYIHLLNVEVLFFGGTPPKSLNYDQYFFPTDRIIGFHIAPPAAEPLDYDPSVENRALLDVDMILGAFMLRGMIRTSTRTDFAAMLEMAHRTWISIYDAHISSPFLPSMSTIQVPMILVSPAQVSFGF